MTAADDGAVAPPAGPLMPVSSIPLDIGLWPDGVVDWHLDEADFPEVPAAMLSTARLAADGKTWLDFGACAIMTMLAGSTFTNLEGSEAQGRSNACREIQEILYAQLVWESHTGIRFVPHRPDEEGFSGNWLEIKVGEGIYGIGQGACSYNVHRWPSLWIYDVIGYHGSSVAHNTLRLKRSPGHYCSRATYIHEFGHALGLWHTQGRQDRDAWVTLGPAATGCEDCVNNRMPAGFLDVGPFDFRSIMLYDSYATNGRATHESDLDCADVSFGDPCGTVAAATATGALTFRPRDVYNMMPFQNAHFGRSSFRPTIEPIESEDCFPASILHAVRVRESPPGAPWNVTAHSDTGQPELTVPLADLFEFPTIADAHPAIHDYTCYRLEREGPDASDPALRRSRLPPDDPDATFRGGTALSDDARDGAALSPTDVSAVFAAYYPLRLNPGSELGSAGDRFGAATASGDFDGDGVQDVAIAAPGAGVVFVFKGTYGDDSGKIWFQAWRALDATGATALAVGDFDKDGFDDLAVGRSEASPRGAVRVFSRLGERGYLENVTSITSLGLAGEATPAGWSPLAAAADGFGAALAVADFDEDGRDDLAIGCPECLPLNYDPSLHEPAGAPLGWAGSNERTGAVYLLRGVDTLDAGLPTAAAVLAPVPTVLDPYSNADVRGSHQGSRFGHGLTFGLPAGGGAMQLFVGAPQAMRLIPDGMGWLTMSHLSGGSIRVGNVYGFVTSGVGSSAVLTFASDSTEDELDAQYGYAVDSPVGDAWALLHGALLVGSPTALVSHGSSVVPAGAVFGVPIPPSSALLGPSTVRIDGSAIDVAFEDCAIAPDDGFGSAIAHGLTAGQTFEPHDRRELVAIGSPRRFVGCSNVAAPSRGAVVTWDLIELRDDILLEAAPAPPEHYIPNPDPAPDGATGFGADICFIKPSSWSFVDLDGTGSAVSTASVYPQGQVGVLVGAQLGWDERSGLPGLPTGIVREIEPLAGGATTVWHALQQGW